MKRWVRTGLMSVGIYLFIFVFNYMFIRRLTGDVIVMVVTAPVYMLLQMFGVVDFGVFFVAGIAFYFAVGILAHIVGEWIEKFFNKFS